MNLTEYRKKKMKIKEIRERAGYSRYEFCNLFEIPYRTLQSWELGERVPPEYVVKLIEKVLDKKD